MWVIRTRLDNANAKVVALKQKKASCEHDLHTSEMSVALEQSGFDEATLQVTTQRAKVKMLKDEFDQATREYEAATTAYDEANADYTEWSTASLAEVAEAEAAWDAMKGQYLALEAALTETGARKTAIESVCKGVRDSLGDRYTQLNAWQVAENTRQQAVVQRFLDAKNAAGMGTGDSGSKNTLQAASDALSAARTALGTEAFNGAGATGFIEARNQARGVLTNAKNDLKDDQQICNEFLASVEDRIDAELRQIAGLNQLKGTLSNLFAYATRVGTTEEYEVQDGSVVACLDAATNEQCVTDQDAPKAPDGTLACSWVVDACLPNQSVSAMAGVGDVVDANGSGFNDVLATLKGRAADRNGNYEGTAQTDAAGNNFETFHNVTADYAEYNFDYTR